jgi:hypothetical protein
MKIVSIILLACLIGCGEISIHPITHTQDTTKTDIQDTIKTVVFIGHEYAKIRVNFYGEVKGIDTNFTFLLVNETVKTLTFNDGYWGGDFPYKIEGEEYDYIIFSRWYTELPDTIDMNIIYR